jgi:hypothetical protein
MFDQLDDLERAIDKVIASERELDLPRLRKLADRLESAWLHALHTRGEVEPGWVAAECRVPLRQARRAVQTAAKLDALPAFHDALLTGEVTPAHAHVVARACTPSRMDARRLSVRQFAGLVKHICDAIDGDDGAAEAITQYESREVYLAKSWRGMGFLQGQLDPEGAEYVITALETRMEDDKRAEGRTRRQRRADALVDICRHYLDTREHPKDERRRGRPHVGAIYALNEDTISELEHMGPISRATMKRLLCDSNVHRVVTGPGSVPLDVGRSSRTIPIGMWRALVARDRHCTAAGCDRPPGWCEAHHVIHWEDGGPTSLENLKLLCWRHHRDHHEGRAHGARAPTR